MDIKQIINWTLHRWWWFIISLVVCTLVAGVYYWKKAPKFSVEAVLMLRQTDRNSNQDEMLQMMGFGGSKIVGDEVKVLSSRDLIGRVADSLDLYVTCRKKGDRYWEDQFPTQEVKVEMLTTVVEGFEMTLGVQQNSYKIKIKKGFQSERLTLTDLSAPIHTIAGDMLLQVNDTLHHGNYRIMVKNRTVAIEELTKQIKVNRLSRESNVITISTVTTCPARSIATINMLLDLYNQSAATDKNRLAIQTQQFLINRIAVVAGELTAIEAQLEEYKRTRQIADLDKAAETYQQTGLSYQQQLAELESELNVLDFMAEQLQQPANRYAMIPGNLGISDNTLVTLIQDYNQRIAHRNMLLQTATEQNPVVQRETEQIDLKRQSIQEGIVQARQTLMLRKNFITQQQQQYDARLAAIPATERCYLELSREKQTKEKQYLYLIEKQEENAMLLASEAVPAKIVDRAQLNPTPVSPRLRWLELITLILGLALPFSVYFFELIRTKYL